MFCVFRSIESPTYSTVQKQADPIHITCCCHTERRFRRPLHDQQLLFIQFRILSFFHWINSFCSMNFCWLHTPLEWHKWGNPLKKNPFSCKIIYEQHQKYYIMPKLILSIHETLWRMGGIFRNYFHVFLATFSQ